MVCFTVLSARGASGALAVVVNVVEEPKPRRIPSGVTVTLYSDSLTRPLMVNGFALVVKTLSATDPLVLARRTSKLLDAGASEIQEITAVLPVTAEEVTELTPKRSEGSKVTSAVGAERPASLKAKTLKECGIRRSEMLTLV